MGHVAPSHHQGHHPAPPPLVSRAQSMTVHPLDASTCTQPSTKLHRPAFFTCFGILIWNLGYSWVQQHIEFQFHRDHVILTYITAKSVWNSVFNINGLKIKINTSNLVQMHIFVGFLSIGSICRNNTFFLNLDDCFRRISGFFKFCATSFNIYFYISIWNLVCGGIHRDWVALQSDYLTSLFYMTDAVCWDKVFIFVICYGDWRQLTLSLMQYCRSILCYSQTQHDVASRIL